MKKIDPVQIFTACVQLIAVSIFVVSLIESFQAFTEQKTGYNQFSLQHESLPLPTVTICMQEMFKGVDENTTSEELLGNLEDHTFSTADFVHPTFFAQIKQWNPKKVFGISGVCTPLTLDKNVTDATSVSYWIKLKTHKKYKVSRHFKS